MEFPINDIYVAAEGEGKFVGIPQIFIRFQGCNIGCLNCDSKNTWDFEAGERYDEHTLFEKVDFLAFERTSPITRVSITGGDPLHPSFKEKVLFIVKRLKQKGFFVNIEAAGVRLDHDIFDVVDFISFDFKTPSTGVKYPKENIFNLYRHYPLDKFQVKAVISTREDYQATFALYHEVKERLGLENLSDWYLTPCYEPHEDLPLHRFRSIHQWNMEDGGDLRVLAQQHKWMWGPSAQSV